MTRSSGPVARAPKVKAPEAEPPKVQEDIPPTVDPAKTLPQPQASNAGVPLERGEKVISEARVGQVRIVVTSFGRKLQLDAFSVTVTKGPPLL